MPLRRNKRWGLQTPLAEIVLRPVCFERDVNARHFCVRPRKRNCVARSWRGGARQVRQSSRERLTQRRPAGAPVRPGGPWCARGKSIEAKPNGRQPTPLNLQGLCALSCSRKATTRARKAAHGGATAMGGSPGGYASTRVSVAHRLWGPSCRARRQSVREGFSWSPVPTALGEVLSAAKKKPS